MPTDFVAHLLRQPLWVQVWVAWMGAVNLASVVFLSRTEARWALGAFVGALFFMQTLFALNGFNRLLGLAHVIFWTPLVVCLAPRVHKIESSTRYGVWIRALLATNATSLVIDYIDVVRYLLGDRA